MHILVHFSLMASRLHSQIFFGLHLAHFPSVIECWTGSSHCSFEHFLMVEEGPTLSEVAACGTAAPVSSGKGRVNMNGEDGTTCCNVGGWGPRNHHLQAFSLAH